MNRLRSAWGLALGYTFLVILFGAVVRITGSGAGCGQHWPTCHGEVAHLPQSLETTIELTHRVTSGLSFLLVVVLTVWTFRAVPAPHLARRAALWATGFMVAESLVGAALVLLSLVGNNDSWQRAVVMAFHLVNTFLLLFALSVAAWACGRPQVQAMPLGATRARPVLVAMALVVLVSAAGAVTALGDTIYPATGGALDVARQAQSQGAHFLERVRGFHPVVAVVACVYLLWSADRLPAGIPRTSVVVLLLIQVGAGLANVWLSAPGWMQVTHLALANLLWLALVSCLLKLGEAESAPDPSAQEPLDSGDEPGTVAS